MFISACVGFMFKVEVTLQTSVISEVWMKLYVCVLSLNGFGEIYDFSETELGIF